MRTQTLGKSLLILVLKKFRSIKQWKRTGQLSRQSSYLPGNIHLPRPAKKNVLYLRRYREICLHCMHTQYNWVCNKLCKLNTEIAKKVTAIWRISASVRVNSQTEDLRQDSIRLSPLMFWQKTIRTPFPILKPNGMVSPIQQVTAISILPLTPSFLIDVLQIKVESSQRAFALRGCHTLIAFHTKNHC